MVAPDVRLLWPSPRPWMTTDELKAWLPAAIEVATVEATANRRARLDDELVRIRRAIDDLKQMLVEVVEKDSTSPLFCEVECPCCEGSYPVERQPGDRPSWQTIAEHIAAPPPECDREKWGASASLRDVLTSNDLPADGRWQVVWPDGAA